MSARLRLAVATLVVSTTLAGCGLVGGGSPSPSVSEPTPTDPYASTATSGTPATTPDPSVSATARPNDLPNGKASRTVRVGNLTVSADYSTPLPVNRWTAAISKPLTISMTAYVSGNRDQKIYLSRVTIYPSSADDQGDLGSLDTIVDSAPISPGYLVTFPNSYGWRIVVGGVNASSRTVTVDIRYELLLYQGGNNPRDYSKQTVTDSLTIPLQ